jgi:ABC-2 type transport system permease protein
MAGINPPPAIRGQFAAIAQLRWRLFVNGLRTVRGRLEIVSRVFMGFGFGVLGLVGSVGIGAAAYYFVSHSQTEGLAVLLWALFLFWQLFPVMANALAENVDSSQLLRFPMTYRAYFLVRMAYGSFEPATVIGLLWLFGMSVGIGVASAPAFLWAVPVLIVFALFNLFLARMIFAWAERWLAQRKTREVLGVIFFLFIVGVQFIGPAIGRYGRQAHPELKQATSELLPLERMLPPGAAAASIAGATRGDMPRAFGGITLLAAYAAAALWLLNVRLRAQYFGENLSEAPARAPAALPVAAAGKKQAVRAGLRIPFVSDATSAVVEKEFRYILRSGPMLFTLVMPVVILLVFRFTGSRPGRQSSFLANSGDLAFPVGAGYALLILSNLVYNSFGADGGGIQFFYLCPARFREILLGKNVAHSLILAGEVFLVWLGSAFLYRPPDFVIFFATITALCFGLFTNLAAGNLLSIFTPKKVDFGTMGRQRASTVTAFASLGVQAATIGIAVATLMIARSFHKTWAAIPVFLVIAIAAGVAYSIVMSRIDKLAIEKRETMITELCRA